MNQFQKLQYMHRHKQGGKRKPGNDRKGEKDAGKERTGSRHSGENL